MQEQSAREGANLLVVYKTLFLDLPLAAMRETFAGESGREAIEAAWKNYDEGVRVATAAINNLDSDLRSDETMDRALQEMLWWQQLSTAFSGAFFIALRPHTIELPTAAEVREFLQELRALYTHHSRTQASGTVKDQQSKPTQVEFNASVFCSTNQQRHENPMSDLFDYFEPIGENATAALSESLRANSSLADFSGFFEPVDYPAAP